MTDIEPNFNLGDPIDSSKKDKQDPVTAWVDSLPKPSLSEALRINRMMDEVMSEVLGRPLRTPEQIKRDQAACMIKVDQPKDKGPQTPPASPK